MTNGDMVIQVGIAGVAGLRKTSFALSCPSPWTICEQPVIFSLYNTNIAKSDGFTFRYKMKWKMFNERGPPDFHTPISKNESKNEYKSKLQKGG